MGRKIYTAYSKIYILTISTIWFQQLIIAVGARIPESRIQIICTAALLDGQYEIRKREYIEAVEKIKKFGFMPYIVESCQTGPTFLDLLSDKVWYAKTNDLALRNKGVNEAKALLNFFKYNPFNDDDIIVKITGRYLFLDDSFLRCVIDHPEYDAFVKYAYLGTLNIKEAAIYTHCFALRYKYFIEFLSQLDLEKMEREMICLEWEISYYLAARSDLKTFLLDRLGLVARVGYNNCVDYV